ncbi:MAG: mannonate dehydratase [Bryobacterales bacterium]|nr:mannonate dehydratase [Bryobacterales bacterium]
MQRRDLAKNFAVAALASTAAAAQSKRTTRKNTLMHVGGDYHSVAGDHITSKQNLEYNLRHGVTHLTAQMRRRPEGWDADELHRMRENCDRMGVQLEALRMDAEYITMRPGPDRDREIEIIAGNVEKASKIGVKVITYHWTVIPIRRNQKTTGRGNVVYNGFRLEENWKDLPTGKSGRVTHDDYWERITFFLRKIVPVAAQHKVKLACHPYDPPGLPFGYQGADNWDSPSILDAIKRYEAVVESPYNGFQLCLGTVAEGTKDPARDVPPIVEYLGQRGKIYQIHMRNIRGRLNQFEEVFPDEGEMDFFEIMRILRDTQFAGSICPDHMPHHSDDPKGLQAFAFGYGYLRALIQAVNTEVRT